MSIQGKCRNAGSTVTRLAFVLVPVLAALLCSACNTVSTRDLQLKSTPVPEKRPTVIYVRDFESDGVDVPGDWQPSALNNFREGVTRQMSKSLQEVLTKAGYNVQMQEAGGELANDGWLLTGRFRRLVNTETETLQLDAQAVRKNRVESTVFIYDLAKSKVQAFMTFRVTGSRFTNESVIEASPAASGPYLNEECTKSAEWIQQTLEDYLKQHSLNAL